RNHPVSSKHLAGWSLFRLLAIYTVPLNVTLLFADAVLILLRFRRERAVLVSFGKWLLLLLVLWIPALLSVIEESAPDSSFAVHHVSAVPPGPDRLVRSLKFLTVWPFAAQDNAIAALFYKVFTLLVAGLIGAGLIRKRPPSALLWVFAWFIIPLMPIVVFSQISIPIWENRYILFVCPYLFILLAAGLTRLWKEWRIAAVAISAIYLIAVSGGLWHYYTVQDRPDYKFNIETLEQYERSGDAIVWSYHYQKPLDHYYDGSSEVYWRTIRDLETAEDIQLWMTQLPTGYERLWFVLDNTTSLTDEVRAAVTSAYRVEETFDYARGSEILLLNPLKSSLPNAPS
ncbi:MAG: hypothetical protein WBD47_18635, partial [Phormidesmis sp.]